MEDLNIHMCSVIVLLFSILLFPGPSNGVRLLNGDLFKAELGKVADEALGVSEMQAEYDKLQFTKNNLNGKDLATQLTNSIARKIRGLVDALNNIKTVVQDNYALFTNSPTMPLCCQATGGVFDYKYRSEVNHDAACIAQSSDTGSKKFATQQVVDAMKDNYRANPNILWQYFAGDDGTYINYPSIKFSKCDYDPRYRPYYVSGASPNPKDVVIVLDKSGSMTTQYGQRSLLQIAQEATVTVINTLTPNDRVGVVAFDTTAKMPGSSDSSSQICYTNQLAAATEDNKRTMSVFINSLSADGSTNYGDALSSAFDFFINSKMSTQGEKRDKVILFLTDGDNSDGPDPLTIIRDKNKLLNNTVIINTYGIGLSVTGFNSLKNISQQILNDNTFGETKHGVSMKIENVDSLRNAIGTYYTNFLSDGSLQSAATFSIPYLDEFSKSGLISSLCLPTYASGGFKGVVCTDLKLSDLLADVTYFQDGDSSYAFIIDGFGRALVHPLLPRPENVETDSSFLDVRYFERSLDAVDIINSMKSGMTGNKTITSKRTIARGTMLLEGVQTTNVKSHYYWSKVPDSNYSLCVVIGDQDYLALLPNQQPSEDAFVYHRRDIMPGQLDNCRHYARFATVERSCVMLTPSTFKEPFKYLDEDETQIKIESYVRYMRGLSTVDPGFKSTIRNSVTTTYKAEAIWKRKQENAKYVIWRYIVSTDGIVRMYPGVQLAKDYDLSQRPCDTQTAGQSCRNIMSVEGITNNYTGNQTEIGIPLKYRRTLANKHVIVLHAPYLDAWGSGYLITLNRAIFERRYRRTLANKNVFVLHAPYLDAWGSGYLISLTQAIFESRQSGVHTSTDKVVAVMGTDFPIRYFYQMVLKTYPVCNTTKTYSCMVIDSSGFLVIHPDFVEPSIDPKLDKLYNIVEKEGDIAIDLTNRGILTKTHCSDFHNGKKQYTYRVSLPISHADGVETDTYEIRPVPDSNVFIVVKKTDINRYQSCCSSGNIAPDRNKCGGATCGCLCYNELQYSECVNEFDTRDSSTTCNARAPSLKSVVEDEQDRINTLKTCYELNCVDRKYETHCYDIAGCNWCSYTSGGNRLEHKVCRLKEECPFGKCANDKACAFSEPVIGKTTTTQGPGESTSNAVTVGIAVGISVGVLLIVLIVGAIFFRSRRKSKKDDPYLHAIPPMTEKDESHTPQGAPSVHVGNYYDPMPVISGPMLVPSGHYEMANSGGTGSDNSSFQYSS